MKCSILKETFCKYKYNIVGLFDYDKKKYFAMITII